MTDTSNIIAKFRAELLGQIFATLSGALSIIVLARLLDPNEYGILFLSISIFGVSIIFTKLGIPKSAGRYISEYNSSKPDQLPHIVYISLKYVIISTIIVSITIIIGHKYITSFLDEPELEPFLLLGIFYIIFRSLAKYTRHILQGYDSIKYASLIYAINQGGTLFFAVSFVLLGYGALGALGGYIFSSFLATIAGGLITYFKIIRPNVGNELVEKGLQRKIGEYAIPLTITDAADALDRQLDTILVAFFLSPIAVSYYTIAKQIVSFLKTPANALGFTLSPTFASEKAEDNIEQASRIFESALVNSLLVYIPAGVGIILVAEPLVEIFFGEEYSDSAPVVQVFGIYAILISVSSITSNGLDFLGRARIRAIAKGITALLNVALNILLIPTFGVVGAAYATVVTFSLYTFTNVYVIGKEFNIRFYLISINILKITIITLCMAAVVTSLLNQVYNWLSLFIVVFVGVFVWAILSSIIGLLDIRRVMNELLAR